MSRSALLAAEPQIFVTDLERALRFYTGQLGFTLAFRHGDPPFYAQVLRDGARLNLRHAESPAFAPAFRLAEPDALSATLTLDDAEPLFREFTAAKVPFHQPLRTEPWDAQTFILRDPDGNLIAVAGRA